MINTEEKVLDLCLTHELLMANNYIKALLEEINVYETRKKWLLESKPSCYRKKKLELYQKEVIALDAKICHYYQELEREIELNIKMGTVLKDE